MIFKSKVLKSLSVILSICLHLKQTKTKVDKQVKFSLVSDMFHLIGIQCPESSAKSISSEVAPNYLRATKQTKTKVQSDQLLQDFKKECARKRNFECKDMVYTNSAFAHFTSNLLTVSPTNMHRCIPLSCYVQALFQILSRSAQ